MHHTPTWHSLLMKHCWLVSSLSGPTNRLAQTPSIQASLVHFLFHFPPSILFSLCLETSLSPGAHAPPPSSHGIEEFCKKWRPKPQGGTLKIFTGPSQMLKTIMSLDSTRFAISKMKSSVRLLSLFGRPYRIVDYLLLPGLVWEKNIVAGWKFTIVYEQANRLIVGWFGVREK